MAQTKLRAKRFLIRCGVLTSLLITLLPLFNYWLDASRVFTSGFDRYVSVEPNFRVAAVRDLLLTKEVPRVIVFGSSRVKMGFNIEADPGWHKLTFPAASVHDHVDSLRAIVAKGRIPEEAWLAIDPDINAYRTRGRVEEFSNTLTYPSTFLGWVHFYRTVLFKRASAAERRLALKKLRGDAELSSFRFVVNQRKAAKADRGQKHKNELLIKPPFHPHDFVPQYFYEELVREIGDFVAICRERDVGCRLFISPRFYKTWLDQDFDQQERFKRLLTEVSAFHDFEGLSPFNRQHKYWRDTSHFVGAVGAAIQRSIEARDDGKPRFGRRVTAENVDRHLARLRANLYRELPGILQRDKQVIVHPSLRSSRATVQPASFSAGCVESEENMTMVGRSAWLRLRGREPQVGEQVLLRISVEAETSGEARVLAPDKPPGSGWTTVYRRGIDEGPNLFFVPLTPEALATGVRIEVEFGDGPYHFKPFEYWFL